ncbi:hypothetical protein CHUAL_000824 [Chamberlinius hualienensis]
MRTWVKLNLNAKNEKVGHLSNGLNRLLLKDKPNNLLFVSNMDDVNVAEPTEHTVQSYYLSALISVNLTTPSPSDDYVVLSNPTTSHRIVETVGILAALVVGAIIIIGVAFIMSKLRKLNSASSSDELTSCEVVIEAGVQNQVLNEANIPHYDIKH